MTKIRLHEASFHYAGTDAMIFEGLNLEIDGSWKSAVVARNGKGKSTLLKLIHGSLAPSRGTIHKEMETGYFPLDVPDTMVTVMDLIKGEVGPFLACEAVMEGFLEGKVSEEVYFEALSQYLELGGYELEANIKRECHRLKLKDDVLYRPYGTLSGGERTKIQIIILFLKPHSYVLLDEPTNHLDAEGIDALADYLASKDGYLVVSHHRHFLNRCTDHIIALEKENVVIRQGNFTQYDTDYRDRKNLETKEREKAQREIDRLQVLARKRRDWSDAKEKTIKGAGDKGAVSAESKRLMKRALHAERRLNEQIEEKKSKVQYREHEPYLKFQQLNDLQELMLVSNLAVGYDQVLVKNLNFTLHQGDRLCLKGPNGCGKTTVIKTLLGEVPTLEGIIKKDNRVKIAYVSQIPAYQKGMLRDILRETGFEESRFRGVLGAMSCHREIFERDLSTFSLGEQKKVDLAFSLLADNHVLIWDEPLNGLDIMTRQAIEEAVLKFQPTLIFTEHDHDFCEQIATGEISLATF